MTLDENGSDGIFDEILDDDDDDDEWILSGNDGIYEMDNRSLDDNERRYDGNDLGCTGGDETLIG